eukprot:TCONS_00026859-protein
MENKDTMLLGCLYRSPTKTETNIFDENNKNMNKLIKDLCLNPKYTHICLKGDFSYKKIDWVHWSSPCEEDSDEEKFLHALRDCFLYQHVLEPTRRRGTDKPSILDLILTGEENQVPEIKYLAPLHLSDHSVLSFKFYGYFTIKNELDGYQYSKANYQFMRYHLSHINWSIEFIQKSIELDVNESWDLFLKQTIELRNLYVPLTYNKNNLSNQRRKGKHPLDP